MKEVSFNTDKINLLGFLFALPVSALMIIPFFIKWRSHIKAEVNLIKNTLSVFDNDLCNMITVILAPVVLIFVGIVVHELIHGFFMIFFSKNKMKSVKLGVMKKSLIPYAQCKEPIKGKKMLIISLAPFVFLGLIPSFYAYNDGNLVLWFIGYSMTLSAIGDFVYAYLILKFGLNKTLLDHKSKVGFVIID